MTMTDLPALSDVAHRELSALALGPRPLALVKDSALNRLCALGYAEKVNLRVGLHKTQRHLQITAEGRAHLAALDRPALPSPSYDLVLGRPHG